MNKRDRCNDYKNQNNLIFYDKDVYQTFHNRELLYRN